MSTDKKASSPANLADRRILRLALGTALSLFFSQAIGWPLSFIAPIFTLLLLSLPRPALGLKGGIGIIVLVTVSIYGGLALLPLLLHYRLVGVLVLGVVLFHSFYFTARGGSQVLGTLVTLGLTLTIAIGSVSVDAVLFVADGAIIGAFWGVVFVWIGFALIPDAPTLQPESPPAPPVKPSQEVARFQAMRSLIIVFPVVLWFLMSPASAAYIGVMMKVASMGQQVTVTKTRAAAESLLISTLIGGIAAVLAWAVLTAWPSLVMYTLLIGLAGLVIGRRIFTGAGVHPQAGTWSYGFLTMIIILAPALLDSPFGSTATAAFFDRLWMFVGATIYGVLAVFVFDQFRTQKPAPAREKINV